MLDSTRQEIIAQRKFSLSNDETIMAEGSSNYLKGTFSTVLGYSYLTNYRLVFCNNHSIGATAVLGITGMIAASARKPKKITIQIILDEIKSMKRTRKETYSVKTTSGKEHTLQFSHDRNWINAMQENGIMITS